MTLTPRAFTLSRGGVKFDLTASTVEDLTDAVGTYVYLFDTAEMLAEQAWAGAEAEHGLITVSEVK